MQYVRNVKNAKKYVTSWWFQPIWKLSVKLDHFLQVGVKIKNLWNHHLDNDDVYLGVSKNSGTPKTPQNDHF